MKLVKSLLLGSAAGLAAVSVAQAADLPARKAAPVDYVRVCNTYGSGFFFIPGTETCLRVSGRVRAELLYSEPDIRADDALGFRALGRLQADARTATAYGLLRSVVRLEGQFRSGSGFGRVGNAESSVGVAQAFIQFGGLTAGRVTSFFSNADLPTSHFGTLRFDDAPETNLFAYTFSFGNGFSASIAVEDAYDRRQEGGVFDFGTFNAVEIDYAGQTMPDLVGNLKYTGTWGNAQLSGAVHQLRDIDADVDTEYGFAVMGSVGINLPFLGAGDSAWLAAAYSSGAVSYSGFGSTRGLLPLGGISSAISGSFGSSAIPDAVISITGDIQKTDVWNVAGGVTHNWTPQLSSSLFGSYARVEFGNSANSPLTGGYVDFSEWRIGTNTIWRPVSGLQLGVEVIYADADFRGRAASVARDAIRAADIGRDVGAVEGRLRVQRDF
ncbi:MAG TPA: porin [Microvirga sp.]|jgi:hypothetical protein|nr:porin [Microvirga sp.]